MKYRLPIKPAIKVFSFSFLAALSLTSWFVLSGKSGNAQESRKVFFIQNQLSSKCIDVSGAPGKANGSPLLLWDCESSGLNRDNGSPTDQQWTLTADGFIKNALSGKCIDVSGAPGKANGSPLLLWDCESSGLNRDNGSSTDQQWTLTADGFIKNTLSGKCIDVSGAPGKTNGSPLWLWDCESSGLNRDNGSPTDQTWNLISTGTVSEHTGHGDSPKACPNAGLEIDPRGRVASLKVSEAIWTNLKKWEIDDLYELVRETLYGKCFKDSFDFIFLVRNSSQRETQYNLRASSRIWGANQLKAVMAFPRHQDLSLGATLHELGHTWFNNLVPTEAWDPSSRQCERMEAHRWFGDYCIERTYKIVDEGQNRGGHWGISGIRGQVGGFDATKLSQDDQGTFIVKGHFGYNNSGGNSYPYAPLELYLMGLASENEVPPLTVYTGITDFKQFRHNAAEDPDNALSIATKEFRFKGKETTYSIKEIKNMAGSLPEYKADQLKEFRVLTVVLTKEPLTQAQWDEVDTQVDWFTHNCEDSPFIGKLKNSEGGALDKEGLKTLHNFCEATKGRAILNAAQIDRDLK